MVGSSAGSAPAATRPKPRLPIGYALRPALLLPRQLPLLAQSHLEEHEQHNRAQAERDQRDGQHFAGQTRDKGGAGRPSHNERRGGSKREDARAERHDATIPLDQLPDQVRVGLERERAEETIIGCLTATSDEGDTMPLYLSRFSYTPETWARLIRNPEDRRKAAEKYIESVGGKLHGFWYAFGERDGYNLWEAPDDVSMAAVALAISGGGALSSLETTVLLTVDDTMEALRKAEQIGYQPPGA